MSSPVTPRRSKRGRTEEEPSSEASSATTRKANLINTCMLVCCLPTQNFQAGLVGRENIFCSVQ